MRFKEQGPLFTLRAIAGTNVVILAWNANAEDDPVLEKLLGFALERTELDANGEPVERYFLRGMKRFKDKDQGLAPGTLVPTNEHPIQSFQWGDYTAKPGRSYRFRLVPVYGSPKLLELDFDNATEVEVRTEPELLINDAAPTAERCHDIYFNRGVIGSQAYARRFGDTAPDALRPDSEPMVWLSRGLFEALTGFIGKARGNRYSLRAAFYEFHYPAVARALTAAAESGADVKIVYDAKTSYAEGNEEMIEAARLDALDCVVGRRKAAGIPHNKFIVLLEDDVPVAVWTGSTNISDGGIFGHSNVGHIVWKRDVAEAYLGYWQRLADDLRASEMIEGNQRAGALPDGMPDDNSVTALFSPRDRKPSSGTLDWYARLMGEAERIICFTVAFTIHPAFQEVLSRESDVLRYIVKDDDLSSSESVGHDGDVLFAAGGYLGEGDLTNFLRERSNPLNQNDYIHTKFMLVDPLGEAPLVVTGSANFSVSSQQKNDENMLVIRGDKRVADIYFGEFMRIFDHHYARYVVRKLKREGGQDANAGYLKPRPRDWVPSHFREGYKMKRRRYFVEG